MARAETNQIELGFMAPDFLLQDVISGEEMSRDALMGNKGLLVMFICNHCPYVKHVIDELVKIGNDYISQGIGVVAINSNDVIRYPEDGPEHMKTWAEELEFPFPYLYDETQDIAKSYDAACTPDFSLFDKEMKCVYRGQLDSSRPNSGIPVTGIDLRTAMNAVVAGNSVPPDQRPSVGCGIKWK